MEIPHRQHLRTAKPKSILRKSHSLPSGFPSLLSPCAAENGEVKKVRFHHDVPESKLVDDLPPPNQRFSTARRLKAPPRSPKKRRHIPGCKSEPTSPPSFGDSGGNSSAREILPLKRCQSWPEDPKETCRRKSLGLEDQVESSSGHQLSPKTNSRFLHTPPLSVLANGLINNGLCPQATASKKRQIDAYAFGVGMIAEDDQQQKEQQEEDSLAARISSPSAKRDNNHDVIGTEEYVVKKANGKSSSAAVVVVATRRRGEAAATHNKTNNGHGDNNKRACLHSPLQQKNMLANNFARPLFFASPPPPLLTTNKKTKKSRRRRNDDDDDGIS
uniref:Uncharacterized protein n=2 Tax=Heterosigma akashiwo TaxID=2829 RepID=A0A7S4D967_HETAK